MKFSPSTPYHHYCAQWLNCYRERRKRSVFFLYFDWNLLFRHSIGKHMPLNSIILLVLFSGDVYAGTWRPMYVKTYTCQVKLTQIRFETLPNGCFSKFKRLLIVSQFRAACRTTNANVILCRSFQPIRNPTVPKWLSFCFRSSVHSQNLVTVYSAFSSVYSCSFAPIYFFIFIIVIPSKSHRETIWIGKREKKCVVKKWSGWSTSEIGRKLRIACHF